MTDEQRRWLSLAGLLLLLAVLSFGSVGALGLDNHDRDNFLDSAAISDDFAHLFSTDKHHPSGRPAYEFLIWAGYVFWGDDPRPFHLLGVVWHLVAALLLTRFLRRLGWTWPPAAAAALLFFYNVSHFRAIHWISAQCYIVSFILVLLGLQAYLDWEKDDGPTRRRAAALYYACLLGGLLVHSATAALLPLSAALAWCRGRPWQAALTRLGPAALACGTAVLAIRAYYANAPQVGQLGGEFSFPALAQSLLYMAGRLLTTAHVLPWPLYEPFIADWAAGIALLAGCAYLAWKRCFWGWWVPLTLAPFLVLSPDHVFGLQAGPSRYLYTASAGVAILLALAADRLAGRIGRGLWGYAPLLPLLLLSHVELRRAEGISYYTSGRSYISLSDGKSALTALEKAVVLCPACIPLEDTYGRLFNTKLSLGSEIAPLLSEARRQLPYSRMLHLLEAVMDSERHEPEAHATIERLIAEQEASPQRISTYDLKATAATFFANRGTGLIKVDSVAQAVVALRHALRYDPQQGTALKNLAFLLARRGQLRQAGVYWDLGGDSEQAMAAWHTALETNPTDWQTRLELARSLARRLQLDAAQEQYDRILGAGPNPTARFERGLLHLLRGDGAAAEKDIGLFVERFGAQAAHEVGLLQKLADLASQLTHPTAAQLLETHWPETSPN